MNKVILDQVQKSNDRQLQEMIAYHSARNQKHLNSIENMLAFFTLITIISIAVFIISSM